VADRGEFTTILAPVPAADPVVSATRLEHDWPARLGVPAHVTLMGPFLSPDRISEEIVERLGELFAGAGPTSFSLTELRRVGEIAYLALEPDDGVRALTARLESAFPDAPRYGAEFGGPLYHLTVARGCDDALFEALSEQLRGALPIQAGIEEAVLVEHGTEQGADTLARFPLGGAAAD
jgi:2'-5' RNA ligase superfamily